MSAPMSGFDAVLRRWGSPAVLYRGEERVRAAPALVQPLFEKERQWGPSPLGRRRTDRFLLLAAPELELDAHERGCRVEWGGRAFAVTAAHPVEVGGRTVYWWAMLAPAAPPGPGCPCPPAGDRGGADCRGGGEEAVAP